MEKAEATAQLVKEEIESDMYIRETLKQNLINYSELARHILPKIKEKNKSANFASVLIAIQRYQDDMKKETSAFNNFIKKTMSKCELIIKNRVITLTYERTKKVVSFISNISKEIKWESGDILFCIQGSAEITIIVDEKNESKFDKIKSELIEKGESLASLSLREPEGEIYSKEIVGFLAFLCGTLAKDNINIYETATTYKQFIFIINEKDVSKAYETLKRLIEHYKK